MKKKLFKKGKSYIKMLSQVPTVKKNVADLFQKVD